MVKALILYTNGKQEVKTLNDVEEFQKIVGGYIEGMPIVHTYYNPEKKKHTSLMVYANEEGLLKELPTNPYAGILSLLGVQLVYGLYIFGNVILFSENEKSIDPYIIKLFADYKECEDDDKFFIELERLNKTKK